MVEVAGRLVLVVLVVVVVEEACGRVLDVELLAPGELDPHAAKTTDMVPSAKRKSVRRIAGWYVVQHETVHAARSASAGTDASTARAEASGLRAA